MQKKLLNALARECKSVCVVRLLPEHSGECVFKVKRYYGILTWELFQRIFPLVSYVTLAP